MRHNWMRKRMPWWACFCSSFILLSFITLPGQAAAPLVADLSNDHIEMDAGFDGTRIFLFGARNDNGDVVIVVRGPAKDYIVRKKERVAGIWMNRERVKFYGIPDFYAIATSKPLSDIEQDQLFSRLHIGQDNLLPAGKKQAFNDAFKTYQRERKLYVDVAQKINFMGETLFKTAIDFPDNIPPGTYTAEMYLISGGDITGIQSTPITVAKSGLDAFVYDYAHNSPFMYGLTAIVLALSMGWFGGRLFEKV